MQLHDWLNMWELDVNVDFVEEKKKNFFPMLVFLECAVVCESEEWISVPLEWWVQLCNSFSHSPRATMMRAAQHHRVQSCVSLHSAVECSCSNYKLQWCSTSCRRVQPRVLQMRRAKAKLLNVMAHCCMLLCSMTHRMVNNLWSLHKILVVIVFRVEVYFMSISQKLEILIDWSEVLIATFHTWNSPL